MPSCDHCGEQVDLPYDCKGCSNTYCSEHRLPENHDCVGLNDWGDPDGVFDSGFDDGVEDDGLADRLGIDTGPTGLRGYFRGNMTFVFLGLMAITFMLQQVVLRVLPGIIGPDAARALYTSTFHLSTEHPEYVWTWVTSIFAHDPTGLFHLLGNGIIIYFFGQSVERYVGSKEFSLLFLGAGVVAGLAQIAVQVFYVGTPGAVLGASGAALAILGTMTVFNPNARVILLIPPVPVPLWLLTGGYAVVSIAFLGGQGGLGGIAHAAHLVGLLVGVTYGQLVKSRVSMPHRLQLGGGRRGGPGGPGGPGPGGGRGPF